MTTRLTLHRGGLSLSIKRPTSPKPPPILPRNDILATDSWADEIIWDATKVSADLFSDADDQSEDGAGESSAAAIAAAAAAASSKGKDKAKQLDPYNLSNDHLYEHTREARNKIRQTFGAIEVFHSAPAKALQMPFVSVHIPAQEFVEAMGKWEAERASKVWPRCLQERRD
jgi:transcription initiation factor TFIID subunit 1